MSGAPAPNANTAIMAAKAYENMAVLKRARKGEYSLFIRLLFFTGARISEIIGAPRRPFTQCLFIGFNIRKGILPTWNAFKDDSVCTDNKCSIPLGFRGVPVFRIDLEKKIIKLASPEIEVFLHELAHAVDHRLNGLKPGQRHDQEVTAEFSAAVIGYLLGYQLPLENMREYIRNYNFQELFRCMARIEKIVTFVIERTGKPIPCMVNL